MAIVWLILKGLMGILLTLMLILFLTMLIILFFPITYDIQYEKYESQCVHVLSKIFYILGIDYQYSEIKHSVSIRICGRVFQTIDLNKQEEQKQGQQENQEELQENQEEKHEQQEKQCKQRENQEEYQEHPCTQNDKEEETQASVQPEEEDTKQAVVQLPKTTDTLQKQVQPSVVSEELIEHNDRDKTKIRNKTKIKRKAKTKQKAKEKVEHKVKDTPKDKIEDKQKVTKSKTEQFKEISDLLKAAWQDPYRKPFVKSVFKAMIGALKPVFPKVFRFNVTIGQENPADTGELMAKLSVVYPFYAKYGSIQGDYTQAGFWGDVVAKGRFTIYQLIAPILALGFKKEVRGYIKNILQIRKVD